MGLFSKDIENLNDLFVHTLQDIYYAEKQIAKALPDMIDKATDTELKDGLARHLEETEGHIRRVEQVFEMHNERSRPSTAPRSTASWRKRTT